jgi:putative chitinase
VVDRKTFFQEVRSSPFKGSLTSSQVSGMGAILDVADTRGTDLAHLAYELATAFHEVGRTMQPIEEYGKGAGRPYGPKHPTTRKAYYGRGFVQLTWFANYLKASKALGVDFVQHPEKALDMDHAAAILSRGMSEGWFTGRKLSDYGYGDKFDPVSARRIINGRNKKRFAAGLDRDADCDLLIAGYFKDFYKALKTSLTAVASLPVDPTPEPASPLPAPPEKSYEGVPPVTLWEALKAILGVFK